MNCPQCSNRIWSDERYCKSCGLNLQLSPFQPAAIPIADDSQLKGVGGWLLFFCILRTIFGPLSVFYSLHYGAGLMEILALLEGVFGLVVGIHVWSLTESAFFLLTIYFSTALLLGSLRFFAS